MAYPVACQSCEPPARLLFAHARQQQMMPGMAQAVPPPTGAQASAMYPPGANGQPQSMALPAPGPMPGGAPTFSGVPAAAQAQSPSVGVPPSAMGVGRNVALGQPSVPSVPSGQMQGGAIMQALALLQRMGLLR